MQKKQRIFLILTIFATCFIFFNSMHTAAESSAQSGRLVSFLESFLGWLGIDTTDCSLTTLVRKAAHVAEFFLQGLCLGLFFLGGKAAFPGRVIYILFFGLLTACADECLQTLFDGRAGMVSDVLIDFGGVLLATAVCLYIWHRKCAKGGDS